jgi:hypothetical protein
VIEYAGPLQRLALSGTLWTVSTPPLLAFAWHLLVGRGRAERARGRADLARVVATGRAVGVGAILLSTAATVAHEVILARAPAGARALFDPLLRCMRVGQLDVGIDLWFDRLSAVACGLVCAIALGASALLVRRGATERDWRSWASLELTVAGALLASMADGFVPTAMGWTLVAAAASWLASWTDGRTAVVTATRGAASVAALTIAASILFWGLGGAWRDSEYVPDPQPRFAVVRSDEESVSAPSQAVEDDTDEPGPGSLTLTSMPGASVFVDDSRNAAMRAPFVRAALPAGSHVLRIRPGGSSGDMVVGPFTLGPGEAIALVQLGPTLSYREIAAELAVREGSDENEPRRALADRTSPFGAHFVATALAFLALAAGATAASSPPSQAPAALGLASRAVGIVLGPFLLARLAFLAPVVHRPRGEMAIAVVGAAIVAVGFSKPSPGLHDRLFGRVPERLGALVVSFERWVIDAVSGAVVVVVRAGAWVAARLDLDAIGAPADAAADRVVRAGLAAEGVTGQPLGRAAWALVAMLALVAIAHAVWPVR